MYDSYKLLQEINPSSSAKDEMRYAKQRQIEDLFYNAIDREDDCTLNGKDFNESPRIFNEKISSTYFHTIQCETINTKDRFKCGDILYYNADYWLCQNSIVFHNMYCTGTFIRTNYTLKWQNAKGNIITQRAYIVPTSDSSIGQTDNNVLQTSDDKYMAIMPLNDNTIELDVDKRLFINLITQKSKVYKITRNDAIPYTDWDNGCISIIFTRDKLNVNTDNEELQICDYTSIATPTIDTTTYTVSIKGNNKLKVGYSRTYKATVVDNTTQKVDDTQIVEWQIVSPIADNIDKVIDGNSITLSITDKHLISTTFILNALLNNVIVQSIDIEVTSIYG